MALTENNFSFSGSSSTATMSHVQVRSVEKKKELIAESEEKSRRDLKQNQSETTPIERKIGFHYFWLPGSITIRLQEFLESGTVLFHQRQVWPLKIRFFQIAINALKDFSTRTLIKKLEPWLHRSIVNSMPISELCFVCLATTRGVRFQSIVCWAQQSETCSHFMRSYKLQ